jgi:hypothetical protein
MIPWTTLLAVSWLSTAQAIPSDYQEVLAILGKKGDFREGVLKVNIPRSDVAVAIAGKPAPLPSDSGDGSRSPRPRTPPKS